MTGKEGETQASTNKKNPVLRRLLTCAINVYHTEVQEMLEVIASQRASHRSMRTLTCCSVNRLVVAIKRRHVPGGGRGGHVTTTAVCPMPLR